MSEESYPRDRRGTRLNFALTPMMGTGLGLDKHEFSFRGTRLNFALTPMMGTALVSFTTRMLNVKNGALLAMGPAGLLWSAPGAHLVSPWAYWSVRGPLWSAPWPL